MDASGHAQLRVCVVLIFFLEQARNVGCVCTQKPSRGEIC
jgi:hypothetical protein